MCQKGRAIVPDLLRIDSLEEDVVCSEKKIESLEEALVSSEKILKKMKISLFVSWVIIWVLVAWHQTVCWLSCFQMFNIL